MSLHRVLGFRAAVSDPGALAAFYAELDLPDLAELEAGWATLGS